jgi:hypothetical protein
MRNFYFQDQKRDDYGENTVAESLDPVFGKESGFK